jgi:hypothetical protein
MTTACHRHWLCQRHRVRLAAIVTSLLFAAACNFPAASTATPTPTAAAVGAAPDQLATAWVDGGNLYVWRTGEGIPRRIASGAVIRPILSPDGAYVAFTRGPQGRPISLWIAELDGSVGHEVAGTSLLAEGIDTAEYLRQINQVAWLDAQTVLFNTQIMPLVSGPGGKADDLWRVDAITRETERLLPDGQGGDFTISPDGQLVALVTPGFYSESPGHIRLITPQGDSVADLMAFDAVATASEYAFYPRLHWLEDSAALLTAIPDPDQVYSINPGAPLRMTALWRLTTAGDVAPIGEVPAQFFGLPHWSPDSQWIAYLEQVGNPEDNSLRLMLAGQDGTGAAEVVRGSAGVLSPPAWSAAGFSFIYHEPGETWLGMPGSPPARFPQADEPAFGLLWADTTTAVYASAYVAPCELRAFELSNPTPAVIATIASGPPVFDAIRLP